MFVVKLDFKAFLYTSQVLAGYLIQLCENSQFFITIWYVTESLESVKSVSEVFLGEQGVY